MIPLLWFCPIRNLPSSLPFLQTIGLNFGYFTSFTIFLAITNGDFCDTYLRSWPGARWLLGLGLPGGKLPLVSLAG